MNKICSKCTCWQEDEENQAFTPHCWFENYPDFYNLPEEQFYKLLAGLKGKECSFFDADCEFCKYDEDCIKYGEGDSVCIYYKDNDKIDN